MIFLIFGIFAAAAATVSNEILEIYPNAVPIHINLRVNKSMPSIELKLNNYKFGSCVKLHQCPHSRYAVLDKEQSSRCFPKRYSNHFNIQPSKANQISANGFVKTKYSEPFDQFRIILFHRTRTRAASFSFANAI